MSDILKEALADKKKVIEIAEQNATKKIVASITPKIKSMIESTLMSDMYEDGDEDDDILLDIVEDPDPVPFGDGLPPEDTMMEPMDDISMAAGGGELDVSAGEDAGITLPDDEGKVIVDMDSLQANEEEYELTGESVSLLKNFIGKKRADPNHIELRTLKMENALNQILKAKKSGFDTVRNQETARQIKLECEKHYYTLREEGDNLNEAVSHKLQQKLERVYSAVMEHYSAAGHLSKILDLVKETNLAAGKLNRKNIITESDLRNHVIECFKLLKDINEVHGSVKGILESVSDDSVGNGDVRQVEMAMAKLYKEIRQMARKNGKLVNEGEIMLKLSLPDSLDVDPGDLDITVVEADPEDMDDDAEEGEDGLDLDSGMDGMDSSGEDDMDLDEEDYLLRVDVPGDEDVDMDGVDVSLADEDMDDMDMELDGMDGEEDMDMDIDDLEDDDVVEIDEAALVREMKKMKKLREEKYKIQHGGHGPSHFDHFGGGSDEGDSFVDGEDLNVHDNADGSSGFLEESDDMDDMDDMDGMDEGDDCDEEDMKESLRSAARRNRRSKRLAENSKKFRAELAETKLLNTKLVALNRVLQVPGLTKTMKEQIVETLDRARTRAEVETQYERIVAALKKRKASMNETVNRASVGSSSRTTQRGSASRTDGNLMVERWAKIAGINQLND